MEGNTHKCVAEEGSRDLFCCRAPHGARGLKLMPDTYTSIQGDVAPRMGRVD